MGRPLRIEEPNGFYHVTPRGNFGQAICADDIDRKAFRLQLRRVVRKYRWLVLAWSLMTNHYHVVVNIPHGGLSDGMRLLNGHYSRIANRRHDRTGHVFQNRFPCTVIESESHLLNACRYAVLNPVAAGLCERPEDWAWSSYRVCAGLELPSSLVASGELLSFFGEDPAEAQDAYRDFVRSGHRQVSDTWISF